MIINFIILFGMLQGLILSFILFFSKKNRQKPGNYFLGIFLLILIYNGLETVNWSAGWNSFFFSFYIFTLIFGVGPSLYLYVQSFINPHKINLKNVLKHYEPVFIQFILRSALIIHWFLGKNHKLTLWLDYWHSTFSEPLSVIWASIYIGISWKEFRKYKQTLTDENSLNEEKKYLLKWTKQFLIFISMIVFMWALSLLAFYFIAKPPFSFYYPTEIALVFLIYWIGFTGYHQMYIVQIQSPKSEPTLLNDFSESEIEQFVQILKKSMGKEKLYLDNQLNVSKLANHLNINPKIISSVLNQQLNKGFNEFINEYRVEEVKNQLLNKENQHLTISAIALEAGFNSQATFQRVFKNVVGMTPKDFLHSEKGK